MIYWLALNKILCSQTNNFIEFLKKEDPYSIFKMNKSDLIRNFQISEKKALKILNKNELDWASTEVEICKKEKIQLITFVSNLYPEILRQIYDPPLLLYVKGDLKESIPGIAIVGARRSTEYGEEIAYKFAKELAKNRVAVISGLAEGIDAFAHKGALDSNGFTIGVIGCGIDKIYPQINENLYKKTEKQGTIISEFPLGSPPLAKNFPIRNRIISGLSNGVLVVEAAKKSGSLITARLALEQNREVYAIPGNINWHYSQGTNELIKKGAKLVDRPDEIILDICPQLIDKNEMKINDKQQMMDLSEEEKNIFKLINNEPIIFDKLVEKSKLDISKISDIIINLQLNGYIKEVSGKRYVRG